MSTLIALLAAAAAAPAEKPLSAEQVFEARITPIFNSPNPSSCVQCHLAGVDLKDYIRPSSRETFLSLRDQGFVDLDSPEKSKILHLIEMGKEYKKGAALIHAKTREAEYAAFAAWLAACCADAELRIAPRLDDAKLAKPARPDAVIRHARKDRVLESFESTVWAMRFRCISCHLEGGEHTTKLVAKHGERVAWFKKTPQETLDYLLGSKLLDTKNPEKSLLLRKPLNDVEHVGGIKMLEGDQGYRAYRSFLEDVAKVRSDAFATAAELPKPAATEMFGSQVWLKLTDTPNAWGFKVLAVKVFAWDGAKESWEAEPIAASDHTVAGKRSFWQQNLMLLAAKDSDRAKAFRKSATLPAGKYLVKVYLDSAGVLARDWKADLGDKDRVGEFELTTEWPVGFKTMTVVEASGVKKK
jgi:hypothetical protein